MLEGTAVVTNDVLTKVIGKGLGFMQGFIREYPGFAYLGLSELNHYDMQRNINGKSGTSMQVRKKINDTQFSKVAKIEASMSPASDGRSVSWYEGKLFALDANVTAVATASTSVVVDDVTNLAVNDRIRTMPASGSAGDETQTTITAINTGTKTLTLATAVTLEVGDRVVFVSPKLVLGQKVTRTVAEGNAQECKVYFQKFGGSVKFQQEDLNKTRLLVDAKTYLSNKFYAPTVQAYENIINTWFFGQNTNTGDAPETEGIMTVIEQREARSQTSIYSTWNSDDKVKLGELQDVLNKAASAPVYTGQEKPTVFCTTQFASNVAKLLQSDIAYQDFIPKELSYGLEALTTPYFRKIQFIVSPEMDRLYGPNISRAFVFPKELVGFRTPEIQGADANGGLIKTMNKFAIIKQPITTNDECEYTTEFKMANIFGGQTYDNAYMLLKDF